MTETVARGSTLFLRQCRNLYCAVTGAPRTGLLLSPGLLTKATLQFYDLERLSAMTLLLCRMPLQLILIIADSYLIHIIS